MIQPQFAKRFGLFVIDEVTTEASDLLVFCRPGLFFTYLAMASTIAGFNEVPLKISSCNLQAWNVSTDIKGSGPEVRAM